MTGEVALCPLRDTLTAPGDQYILGQTGVGINDLEVGELNSTLGELFDEIVQFTVWLLSVSVPITIAVGFELPQWAAVVTHLR